MASSESKLHPLTVTLIVLLISGFCLMVPRLMIAGEGYWSDSIIENILGIFTSALFIGLFQIGPVVCITYIISEIIFTRIKWVESQVDADRLNKVMIIVAVALAITSLGHALFSEAWRR